MSSDLNTQEKDLVVNAVNAGNLNTLSNALKAAGLVAKYKGMGPFTMFAPTEDGKDIDCTMAGGAGALKEFRRAAMELDSSKLRLDVSGTVKEVDGPHKSIELTECKVTAHE